MSPDIPLKIVEWFFQFGLLGFLVGLMALYAIFRGWQYSKLLSGEPEKHAAVFDMVKQLIRSEHWGKRYRLFLHKILAKLTSVIGDSYRFPDEKPVFRADDPVLDKVHEPNELLRFFGINPLTIESYQFCLLLTLFYPILSFLVGWILGGSGTLGTLELISNEVPSLSRWGILLAFLFSFSTALWGRKLSTLKYVVVIAVAVAAIVAAVVLITITPGSFFAVAVGFAAAFTVGISVGFAAGFASGFDGAMSIATSLIASFTGAFAISFALYEVFGLPWYAFLILFMLLKSSLDWLHDKAMLNEVLGLRTYWFIYNLFFLVGSSALLIWVDIPNSAFALLFYILLPLTNAPLDWLSLGITRVLLQSIRFNRHRFVKAFVWGVLDLGLALIALLLVSGAIVSVVSLVNLLAIKPIIDLQALFTSLGSFDNWKDNLWIYFMLLSTLIPTAVHFALVGGSLTLLVSNKKRASILKDIETNDLSAKKAWIYVSVMPAFGFVLAPTLLLYSLYYLLHTHGAWLGNSLLAWAKMLAIMIDPTLGQLAG